MTWYKSKTENVYMIYLAPNGIGIYLEFNPSTDRIEQLIITDKLFNLEKIKNDQDYIKPNKTTINKIWKQIIEHPQWDKMLIKRIFGEK